jgi:type I restriction enzyme, S subunit
VKRVRVGDVLTLKRRLVSINPMDEYRLIGVYSFGKGIFHREPKVGSELDNYKFFTVEPGDLVLSNIQAWEGAIAYANQADTGTVGTHRFLTYAPTTGRIDTNWTRWFFLSEPGMELIRKAAPGTTTRNRTLAIDRFEALEIPLPPIDEQQRVADRLDRLQASAAELAQRSDHASDLAEALAVSATVRPDLDDEAKVLAGWRRVALREVLRPSTNQVHVEPANHYPIAGIYSFGRGLIDRGKISGTDTAYSELTILSVGNIVVSKLNGWEGAVAVVSPHFNGFYVSPEYPVFKADEECLLPTFFHGVARSPWFWKALNSTAKGSMVRRRRITGAGFLGTPIWLPPLNEQIRAAAELHAIDRASRARQNARVRVGALLPAALNEAFADLS